MFAKPEAQLNIVATAQAAALGPSNVVVIGPERAKVLATRYEQIRAKTIKRLEAQEAGSGNGQGPTKPPPQPEEPLADQAPGDSRSSGGAPAQEPLHTKPSSWWRQFIFQGALISKSDAIQALRMILNQLQIPVDERALDFKTDQIVQTTFCEALEKLTDSDLGWRTMTHIYERELRRADHQS
jgi:hypothetical protein